LRLYLTQLKTQYEPRTWIQKLLGRSDGERELATHLLLKFAPTGDKKSEGALTVSSAPVDVRADFSLVKLT
jgi:hypothetical protein